MDAIAMVFSTFLTSISTPIHEHVTDIMGTEVQAQIVEYQGHQVDYQYQLWKIKDASVCASRKQMLISDYSDCTVSAKNMFVETCQYLQSHSQTHWKHKKLKSMYCTSAASYQPVIASISTPDADEAELLEAKQRCSLLTLEARNTGKKSDENERQLACEAYQDLRDKN